MRNWSGYFVTSVGTGGIHYLQIKKCVHDFYWEWHCKNCNDRGVFSAQYLQHMHDDGALTKSNG